MSTFSPSGTAGVGSSTVKGGPSKSNTTEAGIPSVIKLVDENMHWNDGALEVSTSKCKIHVQL